MRRRDFFGACIAGATLARLGMAGQQPRTGRKLYIMDTWFWEERQMPIPEQASLVRRLGCAGMSLCWGAEHAERLAAIRAEKLETVACYAVVDIDGGYPDHLARTLELLKGTGGLVWLALTSKKSKPSEGAGDEAALAIIHRCAEACKAVEVPGIALYPHAGFWMEKVGDAVRLCRQTRRDDVGMQFNQYHWMTADAGKDLAGTLRGAKPYLKGVSINGSGRQPSILPLGEGDYDLRPIIRELNEIGYAGPISHQGYSIKGDLPRRLAAAMETWKQLTV